MNLLTQLLAAVPGVLLVIGTESAYAGEVVDEMGVFACATDKWAESELEKGHKLVEYAGRCVHIPNESAVPRTGEECVGNFEYMPDESWKGSGTCTVSMTDGTKRFYTWEEGSHLKEFRYSVTGGGGKYHGASGGGTYTYENLTDSLSAGTYKGTLELP